MGIFLLLVGLSLWGIAVAAQTTSTIAGDINTPKLDPRAALRIAIPAYESRIVLLQAERAKAEAACESDEEKRNDLEARMRVFINLTRELRELSDHEVKLAAQDAKLDPEKWRPDVGMLVWRRVTVEKP